MAGLRAGRLGYRAGRGKRKWRRLGDGADEVRRREGSDGGDDGSAAHRLQSIELGGGEVYVLGYQRSRWRPEREWKSRR